MIQNGTRRPHGSSEALRSLVQRAVEESDALRHDYVGTGHLLPALLREEREPSAAVLAELGVDRAAARRSSRFR